MALTMVGFSLAEWTGLEPATPGVTGRYSNQLNYHSILFSRFELRSGQHIQAFDYARCFGVP